LPRRIQRCAPRDAAGRDELWPAGDEGIHSEVELALNTFIDTLRKRGVNVTLTDPEIRSMARTAITKHEMILPENALTVRQAVFTKRWMQSRGLVPCEVDKNKGEIAFM
jgi:hypothetical protein